MMSAAFPNSYKMISSCEVDGGRFAAIATQGTGLYGSFFDGQSWSAPVLLYTAPSCTPKGAVRQMTGSGESHLMVGDSQNYGIRNDDYFTTAGTRLF